MTLEPSALTGRPIWPPLVLSLFSLLLLLLHLPKGTALTYKYQLAQFPNPDPKGSFRVFEVNTNTQDVIIGAKNNIFRLDADLALEVFQTIGPNKDSLTCAFVDACSDIEILDNYVKVLAIDYAGNQLVVCMTKHHGICEKRDLRTLELVGKTSDENVISNNPNASAVGFIAPGPAPSATEPKKNVLYMANTYSPLKAADKVVAVQDVPAFSSRRLSDFDLVSTSHTSFTKTAKHFENTLRITFIVQYIYGFSSENFSYMLTVQQKDSSRYHSVIFRVCQEDRDYYSYVEVPLNCTKGNVEYNRLRAAYVAKPGRELALSLNINTQMDVLFGVFTADSPPHADTSMASAAMCVFPMQYIRRSFTENIKRCFEGIGFTGGGHLLVSIPCSKLVDIDTITDDFCHTSDLNQPIQGELPIDRKAHMTFDFNPSLNITSLHVAATDLTRDKYTVAYLSTNNGTVLKVSLDSANVYETVRVAPENTEVRAMAFDDSRESLYLLTERNLLKIATSNCSQYSSCLDCVGAKDPYCGWCSKDYKCSKRSECHPTDVANGWLAYDSDQCPVIKEINPDKIHRGKTRPLTINIQNVPNIPNFNEFRCVFTQLGVTDTGTTWTQANKLSSNKFQCYTPEVDKWPGIGLDGNDSVTMKLTVEMNDQELVHGTITYFNCEYHTTCGSCALSKFPCTWCVKNHKCTDNKEQYCNNDDYILPETPRGPSNPSINYGANYCPSFESLDQSTEILVPAGTTRAITVQGLAMGAVETTDFRCRFLYIDQVKEVPAQYDDANFQITCQREEFNYIQSTSSQDVRFSIVWSGAKNPLGNKNGVHVVMYKCPSLANTCGDCLLLDAKYQCGWCDNRRCDIQDFCQNSVFNVKGAVCKDIHILTFTPKSGPMEGGTKVTITGQNFGSRQDEIDVTVGGVSCLIKEFEAPKKIVCEMSRANSPTTGPIRLSVEQYTAASSGTYSFVQPRIHSIHPAFGPEAGGTVITLMGDHLDSGSSKAVSVGSLNCLETTSINSSALVCKTPAYNSSLMTSVLPVQLFMDSAVVLSKDVGFEYLANPNITWKSRDMLVRSGGLMVNVSGEHLTHVQSPKLVIWYSGQRYVGDCKIFPRLPNNMSCESPLISGLSPSFSATQDLDFGFVMDNVTELLRLSHRFGPMKVYPDPVLDRFDNGEKIHQQNTEQLYINGKHLEPVRQKDVKVYVGQADCVVNSVVSSVVICTPPTTQPSPVFGSGLPEVMVHIGHNLTYNLGILRYEKQEELPQEAVIGIVVGLVGLVVIISVICLYCIVKFRRNDDMLKKMKKDMDQLESRVANECKEAFAELQTDMSELASDLSGSGSIPFWDYRTYCMRVLFPGCNDHPVIRELELDYRHREDTERGLKMFFSLIRNKTFLLIFIRTLESLPDFYMKERVNVASLISVALQTQMEYATEILKTLLEEVIEKSVENPTKLHPKLLLRRNESVAEKMLTNWFTFLLYRFLKDCAGEPLFMLFGAMKQQVSKGPVDAVTGEARYCLSEDKLIRQQINFKSMVLNVMDVDVDRCSQPVHPVKVLDCDTISQVKEKILDAMYKSAPFSSRPPKEELDLVLFDHPTEWMVQDKYQMPLKVFPTKDTKRLVLSDEDNTTKSEGDCRRLNTLSHYKVPDGAYVALHPKQTSIYNMSIMSEKSKLSDNSFSNRSPSLNRSVHTNHVNIDVENCKVYHLVRHQDVESSAKEGERGNKMVSEIYLPRLLVTKGTLQTFVDDLLERIFSTAHRGTVLPLAIKYMFDFLDDQALHHSMGDEVVHRWKTNSLPLRFWVNVIKNPHFTFDVLQSNIVDACLTVIGQTFMDCCSTNEHKLTKDSPSGKLLYAKDIPKYKQWVVRYYQDIKIMPAISDQDMTAMLAEESRIHQNEFNTNAALLELYKYVKKYYDDIVNALEDDEFAKKSKLTYKLDQVSAAMEGTTVC